MPDMITYTETAALVDDLRLMTPLVENGMASPLFIKAADCIETLYNMVEQLEAELEELGEEYAELKQELKEADSA